MKLYLSLESLAEENEEKQTQHDWNNFFLYLARIGRQLLECSLTKNTTYNPESIAEFSTKILIPNMAESLDNFSFYEPKTASRAAIELSNIARLIAVIMALCGFAFRRFTGFLKAKSRATKIAFQTKFIE